jgi:hypothetical protein
MEKIRAVVAQGKRSEMELCIVRFVSSRFRTLCLLAPKRSLVHFTPGAWAAREAVGEGLAVQPRWMAQGAGAEEGAVRHREAGAGEAALRAALEGRGAQKEEEQEEQEEEEEERAAPKGPLGPGPLREPCPSHRRRRRSTTTRKRRKRTKKSRCCRRCLQSRPCHDLRARKAREAQEGRKLEQPVQAQGEPVQGEPVQGEPVQGEPVQGEPVQGEPVQGEPVQEEPVQGEPVQAWEALVQA